MGPGTSREDFETILDVFDWVRRGVVLVHKDTKAKGTSHTSQGQHFIELEREGDYFYLCHGNQYPAIILFGQFVGPPNLFCERGEGWAERCFRWIRTSVSTDRFEGPQKWWAPNHNSTFVQVPTDELQLFESKILVPYFTMQLREFGIS
jgi:hypothetical protein